MAYPSPPVRFDHELIIGDTYQPVIVPLVTTDDPPVAFDLTDSTGLVQLRTEIGAAVALTPTYALDGDGTLGRFTWSASAASTATLAAGTYRYSVRVTFADETVRTILEGLVVARRAAAEA